MSLRHALVSVGTGGILSQAPHNSVTVKALNSVSFTLTDGDRVGLLGHNGAGKSTLLKTLAGIYTPTLGDLSIEGKMSSILQLGAGLNFELNGYDNIIRMGMILGQTKKEAQALTADIEAFAELGEFLSIPVRTYSAGMIARLIFGIATAVQPTILLVDEVLGVGDAHFQEKAKRRIEALINSVRIFVLASHSEYLINLYCNRIMRFEHGCLVDDQYLENHPSKSPKRQLKSA